MQDVYAMPASTDSFLYLSQEPKVQCVSRCLCSDVLLRFGHFPHRGLRLRQIRTISKFTYYERFLLHWHDAVSLSVFLSVTNDAILWAQKVVRTSFLVGISFS